MGIYASTFISGLQEPVSEALLLQIPDARIISLLDGLVVYSTSEAVETIKTRRFFNNTFLVLGKFENLQTDSIEYMIKSVLKMKELKIDLNQDSISRKSTFRIITSRENKLVSVNKELLRNMEVKISKASGLLVDRVKPDLEFWFLYRSEKIGFFMLRLTKHASTEKLLNKGELRPELSYTLCLISEPDDNDIFIDPFCGYGSIPMARSLISPADMIFAADIDKENVRTLKLKSIRQKDGRPVFVKHMDALNMKTFEDGFVDKIVTDPPWGIYENVGMDIEVFYYQMMQEFYRILKINGIAVILTAKKAEFENVLLVFGNKLDLCKKYDILVSGKKASIYKVIKKH